MSNALKRKAKLTAWPNGQGYNYEDWELCQQGGTWYANRRNNGGVVEMTGQGKTWHEAITNAADYEPTYT